MRLWSIEGNRQRLDGGAMFGNVPRTLWLQWLTPDEENRLELACRGLLARDVDHMYGVTVEQPVVKDLALPSWPMVMRSTLRV